MKHEKELFVEIDEKAQIVAPQAGIPKGMDEFVISDNLIEQPIMRRRNYFTEEWSHINIARAKRPFATSELLVDAAGKCFFCPGAEDKTPRDAETGEDYIRLGSNPWSLRAFPNLYPWLLHHLNIVETSIHKASLGDLELKEEIDALKAGARITREFEEKNLHCVFFRNQGTGASLPHYHWQIGALPYVPERIDMELKSCRQFAAKHKENMFDAIIAAEKEKGERFIFEDDLFAVLAPWAPRTNFEYWIIAKKNVSSLSQLSEDEITRLATHLCGYLTKIFEKTTIDCLFILCHQTKADSDYRLHFEIFPIKPWSGAERGFYEFVVEVSPEHTAEVLR